jgi:[acyl-carrier-protein] S-malonyltransferase
MRISYCPRSRAVISSRTVMSEESAIRNPQSAIAFLFPRPGLTVRSAWERISRIIFPRRSRSLKKQTTLSSFRSQRCALRETTRTSSLLPTHSPRSLLLPSPRFARWRRKDFRHPRTSRDTAWANILHWLPSGVLSFADAVRTVRKRGTYMQEAVPVGVGAMAAILGLDVESVEQGCACSCRRSGL